MRHYFSFIFFTFEILSLVWSIYWKTFFISFEALSKQHAWNFRWLGRGWMRWRGPTRELTQFDLVLGHQECLGLPQLLMTWRKMIWTSKVDPVWENRLALGYKICLTCPNERIRKKEGTSKVSLIWGFGLTYCPSQEGMKRLKKDRDLKSFPYLRIWIDTLPHLWRGWKKMGI